MTLHLKIIGVLLMLLSLIHILFPRYFKWKDELKGLTLINRQVMYIHTFFIALVVMQMGILCFNYSAELLRPGLGRTVTLGLGIFWGARLIVQFFGYSSLLWRGKRFETMIHFLFAILWCYFTTVFFIVALQ
ncbi:MAG: hypothetical protein EOP55_22475 [Sphingobacteriales bacterium]|nr:MAG: hypothetical protein EOP55_22475 [Sphingobacteriales bacterium]